MALLLHTGGTIGMVAGPDGLRPRAGVVEAAVAARRSGLTVHVFDPLLDSADVGPAEWNRMLDAIDRHPGVPVLLTHGTDTLSFTGAALSQALAGTGRRVILCASMTPLGQGGDAEGNLDIALSALDGEGGVFLAFNGALLPAGGLVKIDSHQADAFVAIPQAVAAAPDLRRFDGRRLAILTLTPGLTPEVLEAMLAPLDGAVLRVFGAGTMMATPGLAEVMARAVTRGTRIRVVSQCLRGGLAAGSYAAGAALWQTGVEDGGTDTPEAAMIRLWLTTP
ncbi:asparaginase domain-containing protein [Falsirhodobacter halotolerans]|uniref:asparaginase domain-containing protein n=1 Tax=Falsirhodobacter halotolerans TaxID=1146892 RepID=UPI001FCFABB9|nr:asparaginase domain-containing protein [Falsirhodobacter halotolerans]MCJ8141181.1 asparaginase domain-containing protein [Falsirhodobacter halotolerans]